MRRMLWRPSKAEEAWSGGNVGWWEKRGGGGGGGHCLALLTVVEGRVVEVVGVTAVGSGNCALPEFTIILSTSASSFSLIHIENFLFQYFFLIFVNINGGDFNFNH